MKPPQFEIDPSANYAPSPEDAPTREELSALRRALSRAKAVPERKGKVTCFWVRGELVCYVDRQVARL